MKYWFFSLALAALSIVAYATAGQGVNNGQQLENTEAPVVELTEDGELDLPDSLGSSDFGSVVVEENDQFNDQVAGNQKPTYLKTNSDESQGGFDRIVNSIWFAFITGIASVISIIFTLYTLRVRHHIHSRYRILEWQKIILIASGVGLLTFGSISFYMQPRPPAFLLFRGIYDSVHGFSGSRWDSGPYYWQAVLQTADYTVTVTEVSSIADETHILYNARCTGVSPCNPFPDAGIRIGQGKIYTPINHERNIIGTSLNGYLTFPNVASECGTLSLWEHVSAAKDNEGEMGTAPFRLTTDSREKGTSVWGLLSMLGLVLLIFGIRYDPLSLMKRKLLDEGKDIREQQKKELAETLGGRSYEKLSTAEKHKYNDTREYYAKSLEIIFLMHSGVKRPDEDDK